MLYGHHRSVPANTTQDNPDKQTLAITKGTIMGWVIFFDPEAANLLHVRVEYHGFKILPYGELEAIVGFLKPVTLEESIKIEKEPAELKIIAWNEDDSYQHEYYIHPIVIPPSAVSPLGEEEAGMIERFMQWLGLG